MNIAQASAVQLCSKILTSQSLVVLRSIGVTTAMSGAGGLHLARAMLGAAEDVLLLDGLQ